MVGAVLLAFVVGVAVGLALGRRYAVDRSAPARPAVPPASSAGAPTVTKRGRKAGLTEESFKRSDDILERLRRAEAGELDPSELHASPPASAPEPEPEPEELPGSADLAERERRILERLQRERQSDFSKQRDNDEER